MQIISSTDFLASYTLRLHKSGKGVTEISSGTANKVYLLVNKLEESLWEGLNFEESGLTG